MAKRHIGTFNGHINSNQEKIVTFNDEPLDPKLDLFNHSRIGLDWGYVGSGALQLSFAILFHIFSEEEAKTFRTQFSKDVVSKLPNNWELTSKEVRQWMAKAKGELLTDDGDIYNNHTPANNQLNIVKKVCMELDITQKKLAEILEVPEGTVSSWAVRDELPRLAKKAIEFYIQKQRNDKIVKQFRDLIALVS